MKEIAPKFGAKIEQAKEQGLKELDLSNYYKTANIDKLEEIPPEVFELEQLESLNLSWNNITTIPQSITRLQNLKALNLSRNQIKTCQSLSGNSLT